MPPLTFDLNLSPRALISLEAYAVDHGLSREAAARTLIELQLARWEAEQG